MNEMIQNYIDKRKEEIALEHEREKHQLLENLSIGNKIYSDSNKRTLEFPLYYEYDLNNKAYRIDAADNLSEEDYAELLKYVPKKDKPKTESKEEMSGWYYFAIIMMFIGCIGGIALGVKNKDAVVAIASVLGVLIFFSQIILLCKIEYNTRSKK